MLNLNLLDFIVAEISMFIRTDLNGQIDLAAIDPDQEYKCRLYGRKRFLLPVTYLLTNLVKGFYSTSIGNNKTTVSQLVQT